jgi:hypothetical protein
MQSKFGERFVLVLVCFGIALFSVTSAAAQNGNNNAPSLAEQIKAQYQVTRLTVGPTGFKVATPGTVLDVQKGGLLSVPPTSMMVCPARFQDNDLKAPTGMCPQMVKQISRFFDKGEKVYVTRIDVSLDHDRVVFQLMECDSCNGTQQPSQYKSEVIFQSAKGSLWNANATTVEDTIGQVLSIDSGDQQGDQNSQNQGGNQGGGNDQGNGNNQQAQGNDQGGGQNQPPAQPQQIDKGQTPDQVKAALGNPDKIVNLGSKMIYVYKDLKVTFIDGKVSDVQ